MCRSKCLDEGFAKCREQACEGDRAGVLRPRSPVHGDPKLARGGKGNLGEVDLEVSLAAIILDGNSQVCFRKIMVAREVMKVSRARGRACLVV